MKKLVIFLRSALVLLFICICSISLAQSTEKINTYYNSLKGSYENLDFQELRFINQVATDPMGTSCTQSGQMSSFNHDLYFCRNNYWDSVDFQPWMQEKVTNDHNYIYLKPNIDPPKVKIGIGTDPDIDLDLALNLGCDKITGPFITKILMHDGSILAVGDKDQDEGTPLSFTGAGTRMMWYPRKQAFRAGTLDPGIQYWDDIPTYRNIGDYSVAFGHNTEAQDLGAFAVGEGSQAMSGHKPIAMGYFAKAEGSTTVAIGNNVSSNTLAESVFGECNDPIDKFNTNSGVTWHKEDPIFVIGNGEYDTSASGCSTNSNAITVLKRGMVGIGDMSAHDNKPIAALDVNEDEFIIESGSTDGAQLAFITLGKTDDPEYFFESSADHFNINRRPSGYSNDTGEQTIIHIGDRSVGIMDSTPPSPSFRGLYVKGDIHASGDVVAGNSTAGGYVQVTPTSTLDSPCTSGEISFYIGGGITAKHFWYCNDAHNWKMICYKDDDLPPSCPAP